MSEKPYRVERDDRRGKVHGPNGYASAWLHEDMADEHCDQLNDVWADGFAAGAASAARVVEAAWALMSTGFHSNNHHDGDRFLVGGPQYRAFVDALDQSSGGRSDHPG